MIAAQSLVKYTANLRWRDQNGEEHSERHAAWDARQATTDAYRRARSMIRAGQARCYRIEHHEKPYDGGSVQPVNDPFAIPEAA
jgi:hypothetical protein